ncbi:MAG TPA: hypothetical protein VEP90_30250 [Methylomirabilota bacterium]|nr:hypothetical protein [Methylomirabilota bacterium]
MRKNAILVRQEPLFTVRGDIPLSDYPRLYRAESLDISLHLSRSSSGSYLLLGILTSRDTSENSDAFEGMDVDLYAAPGPLWIHGDTWVGKPLLSTKIDDLGHIVLSDVPEGEFVMVLYLPAFEVIVEGLTIP